MGVVWPHTSAFQSRTAASNASTSGVSSAKMPSFVRTAKSWTNDHRTTVGASAGRPCVPLKRPVLSPGDPMRQMLGQMHAQTPDL